jgi:hypothetical protein
MEETSQSRYVKLTKEQPTVEQDIIPGELNQPIDVPQVSFSSRSILSLSLCNCITLYGFVLPCGYAVLDLTC